ncbi:MAG: hypothetical protein AAFQ53_03550 [Bacteroidota bacterium]
MTWFSPTRRESARLQEQPGLAFTLAFILLLITGLGVSTPGAHAQGGGAIDGLTLGLGLGVYQGELDRNASSNPIEYFALAEFSLSVHADRALSPLFMAEAGLVYHRFNIDVDADNSMGVNVFAFDVNAGLRVGLFGRTGFVRLQAGVAPTMVSTTYNFSTPDVLESRGYVFEQTSPRFILTFPVSMILQDAWRFGIRFMTSDFLDSAQRRTTGPDVISSIHVGYRFRL